MTGATRVDAAAARVSVPGADEPLVCDGCRPPLKNRGGPIMGTNGRPGEITVTPIYWAPAGFSFSSDYTRIVNGFIADIAAASGKTDNVYSVNTE